MTFDAAFTQFPTLSTRRLCLRALHRADAEALFAIKSDLEVTRQYGQEPHGAPDETRAWIQRRQADYAQRDALFWALALPDDDRLIGGCTYWNFEPGLRCAEIGYELHPAYQGQGLMTEALSAVVAYGFAGLGLHRIEANPLAANLPSQNLLRRLGFTYEGTLRERVFFRGHFYDQLYFGLLEGEWGVDATSAIPALPD